MMSAMPALSDAVASFRDRFDGTVIEPADAGYDEARRLWNGMIDLRPALIARPRSATAVADAIGFARGHELPIAVRGGGHNVAGLASVADGLVVDLAALRHVEVDPARRTARVGGGATWGDVDRVTQPFGLAAPGGVVSETGVAGLTLGGGMGWLRRRYGLSADNLIGAELVTADGSVVRATESEHQDLLWGLRGGGGNFGVVTEFEFRLHPVGPVVAFAFVLYPLDDAVRVLRSHEALVEADAGDISTLAVLGFVPPMDGIDPAVVGAPFVGVLGMHAGDPEAGMRALQPFRELATPLVDLSGPMPYVEAQTIYDADYPAGHRYYWKSSRLAALTDDAIDVLVRHLRAAPSAHSTIDIWLHGGAVEAVDAEATAYGRRDIRYLVSPEGNWEHAEDDAANVAWVRALLRELEPHAAGGAYLNFPGLLEEGDALVRQSLGATYERLAALKASYDPDNVFRRNHNVRPEPAG
jgi:FAD/FMN-containing dehydrogenase